MTFAPLKKSLAVSLVAFLVLLFVSPRVVAQPSSHVSWSFTTKMINACECDLIFTATIENSWHMYSQNAGKPIPGGDAVPGDGPTPTSFLFKKSPDYKLVGKASEPAGHPDDAWKSLGVDVMSFEKTAVFKQRVKILSDKEITIKGTIEGMVCTSEGQCVPFFPQPKFEFKVKGDGTCVATIKDSAIPVVTDTGKNDSAKKVDTSALPDSKIPQKPQTYKEEVKDASIWGAFAGGFVGGLIALIMPCVFPMIPMTVSFFTKRSKSRAEGIKNAIIYALSIIVIYVILGLLVTLSAGSPQAVNQLSSNIWLNLAFFAIFVLFGISFLGAFEIALPSRFVNKVDKASDRGGLIGIFFMAFTLTLVTFSCTGPIIGTALVEALHVGVKGPLFVMLGFSIALALPFALFAMFPGWLNSLPKSGGWLNAVKIVMGLVEFALAMKFISNVDLSYHWGLITREVFLAVWIVCFAMIGFYLLGKLKFSHDSDVPHVSTPRAVLAILSFTFVVYLIPGMWGAPVRALSGILPPSYHSENLSSFVQKSNSEKVNDSLPEGVDPAHCPLNLSCFHNYDLALEYAKKVNKPLFIDFTGYNCANCRRMEDNVWPEPSVLRYLQNEYVVVSLYCDDKTELPANMKYETPEGYSIETWGNKWSQMQIDRYGSNAQPLYVLLDSKEQMLQPKPMPYNSNVKEYEEFLANGLKEFKKRSPGK